MHFLEIKEIKKSGPLSWQNILKKKGKLSAHLAVSQIFGGCLEELKLIWVLNGLMGMKECTILVCEIVCCEVFIG